jgi:hypothetical protein
MKLAKLQTDIDLVIRGRRNRPIRRLVVLIFIAATIGTLIALNLEASAAIAGVVSILSGATILAIAVPIARIRRDA